MNESPIDLDAVPWKKIGRRWRTVLCAMLFINGVTVVWAVCDKAMTAPAGTAIAAESPDVAATAEQLAAAASAQPAPANAAPPETAIEAPSQVIASAPTDERASSEATAVVASAAEHSGGSLSKPANSNDESKPVASIENAPNKPEVKRESEIELAGTLLIINPPTTGGVVHYMIDGKMLSLMPSEYRRLIVDDKLRVQYHRGDELTDEEQLVGSGAYVFGVSDAGWDLAPLSGDAIQRMLQLCRLVE